MIVLGTNKSIMRLNLPNNAFFEFWSHDWRDDILIDFIRQIWPHEQIEIWSHDQKFDLMKKLNFDLMKFNLMIISKLPRIFWNFFFAGIWVSSIFPLPFPSTGHLFVNADAISWSKKLLISCFDFLKFDLLAPTRAKPSSPASITYISNQVMCLLWVIFK